MIGRERMKIKNILIPRRTGFQKIFIVIFCNLVISASAYAMQVNDGICHLARLPKDVHDIIASYLPLRTIETEADFVYRTEIKSYNVGDYHKEAQEYQRPQGCFSGDSPDSLKKVFLDQSIMGRSRVVGSERVPQKDSVSVSLDEVAKLIDEDDEYCQTIDITISSDGNWFGRLAQQKIGYAVDAGQDWADGAIELKSL